MIKQVLYISIIVLPFAFMIGTNEFVRSNMPKEGCYRNGVPAINCSTKHQDKCSWVCHDNTNYCKEYHVKIANGHYHIIDPLYFGIINSLQSTGNYSIANIVVLVVLLPAIMFYLLIKSIAIQFEIRELKKSNSTWST